MRKNIVHYVTRQYMKQNKKRTLTAFAGIVCMVLLMTCVFVGKDTAIAYLERVASKKDGLWHVSMYDVTEKELEQVNALPYVEQTAVSADQGFTDFSLSANDQRPYLFVKSYSPQCFDWMNITLKSGRLPENSGEIVLSETALSDGAEIEVGDTIQAEFFTRSVTGIDPDTEKTFFPFYGIDLEYGETVSVPQAFPYYGENDSFRENREFLGTSGTYEVVGIIEQPSWEDTGSAGYPAICGLDSQEAAGLGQFNLSIILDLNRVPSSYGQDLRDIAGTHEIDFNNYLLAFSGNSSDTTINAVVGFLTVFFTAMIILASVLLIYNVFRLSFRERSRYLGMLASVGATRRQKRGSVYYEAGTLLLPALPLGILAGLGIVELGMLGINPFLGKLLMLERYLDTGAIPLSVSPRALAAVILLSIATTLLSAFLPARKIGKIGPIESIRGNADTKNRTFRMRPGLIRRFKAEGMLAADTVSRQKKSSKAVVSAAAVFMIVMMLASCGAAAISRIVDVKIGSSGDITVNSGDWDYFVTGDNRSEIKALARELSAEEDVASVRQWYTGLFVSTVSMDTYSQEYWDDMRDLFGLYYRRELSVEEFMELAPVNEQSVNLLAVDSETLDEIAAIAGADAEALKSSHAAIVVNDGSMSTDTVRIWQMTPERYRYYYISSLTDLEKGDRISMKIYSPAKEEQVPFSVDIAGFVTKEQLDKYVTLNGHQIWLIVSTATCEAIMDINEEADGNSYGVLTTDLYIRMANPNSPVLDRLESFSNQDSSNMAVVPANITQTMSSAILTIVRVLLVCFVILTSAICLLNLVNSINGRLAERRREFAILKSIGMTGKQLRKMLLMECAALLLKTVLPVLLITGLSVLVMHRGLTLIFGNVYLPIPWIPCAGAAVLAFLAVVIITLRAGFSKENANLLEEIRSESI